jgi:hypothetical protein
LARFGVRGATQQRFACGGVAGCVAGENIGVSMAWTPAATQQREIARSLICAHAPALMGRFCVLLRCCVAHSFYLFEKKEKYKATAQQHPSNSLPQWVLLKSANHLKNNKKGGFYGQG